MTLHDSVDFDPTVAAETTPASAPEGELDPAAAAAYAENVIASVSEARDVPPEEAAAVEALTQAIEEELGGGPRFANDPEFQAAKAGLVNDVYGNSGPETVVAGQQIVNDAEFEAAKRQFNQEVHGQPVDISTESAPIEVPAVAAAEVAPTPSFGEKRAAFEDALANATTIEEIANALDGYAIDGEMLSDSPSGKISARRAKQALVDGFGTNISDSRIQAAVVRVASLTKAPVENIPELTVGEAATEVVAPLPEAEVAPTPTFGEKRAAFEDALTNATTIEEIANAMDGYAIDGEMMSNTPSGKISADRAKQALLGGFGANISDTRIQDAVARVSAPRTPTVESIPAPVIDIAAEVTPPNIAAESGEPLAAAAEMPEAIAEKGPLSPQEVTEAMSKATTFAELAAILDGAESYQNYSGDTVSLEQAKAQFALVMKGIDRWQKTKSVLGAEHNTALVELDRLIHGNESYSKLGGVLGVRLNKLADEQKVWNQGSPDVR